MQLISAISFKLWLVVAALLTTSTFSHAETCRENIPPSNPDSAYTRHGDGTVTHIATGLMWKYCAEGQTWTGSNCIGSASKHTWTQALTLGNTSSFAGHTDWRLPSIKELHSLVEECRSAPSINAEIFPNTPFTGNYAPFWSSSANSTREAWVVDFVLGITSLADRNDNSLIFPIRLVRGGQSFNYAGVTTTTLLNLQLNDSGISGISDDTNDNLASVPPTHPQQDATLGRDALAAAGKLTKTGGGGKGFDYTKIANDGSELPVNATLGTGAKEWACTRDNVTGLMWEVKTTEGLRSQNHSYSWYKSNPANNDDGVGISSGGSCFSSGRCDTEKYVQDINATGLCGASDWRMPHIKELEGIVDYGRTGPSIDSTYFPNTSSSLFLSGTREVIYLNGPWVAFFLFGDITTFDWSSNSVRLVRGGR